MHSLLLESANVLGGQFITQVVPLRKYEPEQLVHSLDVPPLQLAQGVEHTKIILKSNICAQHLEVNTLTCRTRGVSRCRTSSITLAIV